MGLPFNKFFDTTDKAIYPSGAEYASLWGEAILLSDATKKQIEGHFSERFVCHSYPQYWLQRWYNLITREQDKWLKLIASEDILSADAGKWNTDVYETVNSESESSGKSSGSAKQAQSQTDSTFSSDTPDGEIEDIETYMTSGGRVNTATSGESSNSGESSSSDKGTVTTRRYGNIGVMTSAQILGGYRQAVSFCAEDVIFAELECLFLSDYGDEYEDFGYLWQEG